VEVSANADWVQALEDQNRAVWSRTAPTYATAAELMTGAVVEPLLDAARRRKWD
jgi:hypothetical protein